MKIGHALVLGFIIVLISVVCVSADDVQGETKANPVVDAKTHASAEVKNAEKEKPGEVEKKSSPVVKDGDRVDGDKKGAQNGSDASEQVLKKETRDADGGSSGKTQGKDTEQKEKKRVVADPKEGTKIDEGSSGGSTTDLKKEKPQGEECDISNRCTDKENKLVACLRVPGNDAPGLSLFIQNKGKGTMVVKISVPKFVEVEKTSIEVKEKENQKVKVSFKKSGKGGDILLNTGTGHCSLDLKSLIANNNGGKEVASLSKSKSKYLVFLTETKSLSFMFLALIVIIASVGVWVSIRRRRRVATVSSYQKLDMELPISNAGQEIVNASDVNDGWDNGWDDNWDDEEAPMSPMPVTPSLSSKGLASRKLNKD